MNTTAENITITVNTLLYIIGKLGGTGDFHKVFKILYFADQKHLVRYGSAITGDRYIAMSYGPVPSMAYDIVKSLRNDGLMAQFHDQFSPYFELVGKSGLKAKINADRDYLSESEMRCIDESIEECAHLSFRERTERSHDSAWHKAENNGEMDLVDIARAGGADSGMITYISECLENRDATFE